MGSEDTPIPGPLNNVIRIDDERIKGHLDRIVRGTLEETLNALLDAEAEGFRGEAKSWHGLSSAQRRPSERGRSTFDSGHSQVALTTRDVLGVRHDRRDAKT